MKTQRIGSGLPIPDGVVLGITVIEVSGTPWLYDQDVLIFDTPAEADAWVSGFEAADREQVVYTETGYRIAEARRMAVHHPAMYGPELALVEQTFAMLRAKS